ncbi:MAG: purine phosphorylase [Gammaproteobacteria bacterium]|nr:purine phosphorylase [Gammaproteobacteria bacterium]
MFVHPLRTADARRIGVVIALPAEARSFVRASGPDLEIAVVGPGPARAEAGARELIERGAGALLSWGTSGALVGNLAAGTLVLGEVLRDERGDEYVSDPVWLALAAEALAPLAPRRARCMTVERPASHSRAKQTLARETGCAAVDMESAAVAANAARARLPFLAVRSIVDPVDCDLPRCVMAALDADGRTHILSLFAALARRPWEAVGLVRLAGHFNASLRALGEAARLLSAATPTSIASLA